MQGIEDPQRGYLDVESLAGDLLAPGSAFAFLAKDRIISVVDPEARHAHKSRSVMRDGYKGHIVGEPATGLITSASVTKAAGPGSSDPDAGKELLGALQKTEKIPRQALASGGNGLNLPVPIQYELEGLAMSHGPHPTLTA